MENYDQVYAAKPKEKPTKTGNNGIAGYKKEERKKEEVTTSRERGSSSVQRKNVGGRPPAPTQAYIDAIKSGYPPETLLDMMQEAYEMAVRTNSWRGMVAVAEFMAAYGLGKPVKRVESSGDSSLADLLAGVDTSKPLLSIGNRGDNVCNSTLLHTSDGSNGSGEGNESAENESEDIDG